jgi:hypothetical protein
MEIKQKKVNSTIILTFYQISICNRKTWSWVLASTLETEVKQKKSIITIQAAVGMQGEANFHLKPTQE